MRYIGTIQRKNVGTVKLYMSYLPGQDYRPHLVEQYPDSTVHQGSGHARSFENLVCVACAQYGRDPLFDLRLGRAAARTIGLLPNISVAQQGWAW